MYNIAIFKNWRTNLMLFKHKSIKLLFLLISLLFFLFACGDKEPETGDNIEVDEQKPTVEQIVEYPEIKENPIVTIIMEDDQEMILELYPKIAPNTVANFISLINDGFYDGLIFHRVIPNFMIQGGDPEGNGLGGPDYSIPGEFTNNNFENDLKHERGVISMARSGSPNSAGSQFFIMQDSAEYLDGEYAAFGKIIEGIHVVDHIAYLKRDNSDKPLEDFEIKSITVDTKGINYPDPVKQ